MAEMEEIRETLIRALDEEESDREFLYRGSRELIKVCRDSISRIVGQGPIDEGPILTKAESLTTSSKYAFVEDALTEAAEALLLNRLMRKEPLPLPRELPLSERAYALGVCDAVGELRRISLNRILEGDIDGALGSYERMKDLFSLVEGLTYPSGMIQLKRKQDSARASLDRTLGEITVALSARR